MTLEEKAVEQLLTKKYTVTTAESCTGGLIAATLINVSGVSEIYKEGYITYANEAKEKLLGVRRETLENYGAVSEQTACEMAVGAYQSAGADVSLVSTGIAGPSGGTEEKPVGLVYLGCCLKGRVTVRKENFHGDRESIRHQAVTAALELLLYVLSEETDSQVQEESI